MSKLFKLKEWLTVPDAAKHLSIAFGEEVSEADVLRLALAGHLKLSVNFVNHTQAKRGKVVNIPEAELLAAIKTGNLPSELEWGEFSAEMMQFASCIPDDQKDKPVTYLRSLKLDSDRYLNLSTEVTSISGIWDLPMLGGEQLDIEHQYQMLTGGTAVTLETLEGAFVEKPGSVMCQLQEDFDNNEYQSGSKAQLHKIEERIAIKNIKGADAQKLLDKHKEDRKAFLEERKGQDKANNYFPAGGLPEDAVIVVRTTAIREFEQTVNGSPAQTDKPLTTTERNSLLTVIAGLCDYSDIKPQERGAATQIANMTEEIGAAITDDTIRKILAKIPDALESRKK